LLNSLEETNVFAISRSFRDLTAPYSVFLFHSIGLVLVKKEKRAKVTVGTNLTVNLQQLQCGTRQKILGPTTRLLGVVSTTRVVEARIILEALYGAPVGLSFPAKT
jgi:hypothetical protein